MKLIEYKKDFSSPVRTAIFEALWPIRRYQRREVVEELLCSGYYFGVGRNVTIIVGTVIEVYRKMAEEGFITIYALPKGMTLKVSIDDVLTKTKPV